MDHYDVGFLGGGQLARMSIQAAQRMGLKCLSLDPEEHSPASQIAHAIQAPLDDEEGLIRIFSECRFVTLENEFVVAGLVDRAMEWSKFDPAHLMPGTVSLSTIQDKLMQRSVFQTNGVPSPNAVELDKAETAIAEIGFPMVLKARFGGYDGKGTRYARNAEELASYENLWSGGGWLAESMVPFRREIAQMVVRTKSGTMAFPTVETVQTNHVCDLVFPCDRDAADVAIAAIEAIEGYGLFGVEMFELEDGSVQVNEIAPRPHNTGHYTLDWGGLSQFDVHVRAVAGLPIPEIRGSTDVCMANLLGQPGAGDYRKALPAALNDPGARFHWYGKKESRPGRKMGHLNMVGEGGPELVKRAGAARQAFYEEWTIA